MTNILVKIKQKTRINIKLGGFTTKIEHFEQLTGKMFQNTLI